MKNTHFITIYVLLLARQTCSLINTHTKKTSNCFYFISIFYYGQLITTYEKSALYPVNEVVCFYHKKKQTQKSRVKEIHVTSMHNKTRRSHKK